MNRTVESYLLLFSGIFSLLLDVIGCSYYEMLVEVYQISDWIVFIALVFVFLYGIALVVLGFYLYLVSMEKMDVESYFSEDKDLQFDLKHQYDEYCRTLLPKRKAKRFKRKIKKNKCRVLKERKKYSTWHDELLKKYNRIGSNDKKKKNITLDMQQYIRWIKRRITLTDTVMTTVLAPAEIGLVAIVCTSKEYSGVLPATLFTLIICVLFALVLRTNHKISCFIDDVAGILGLDLDNKQGK